MLLAVRAWILVSALLVGAGWILSACHELNLGGYVVVFALAAAVCFFCRGKIPWPKRGRLARGFHKCWRRFKRPAPLLFLALASLSFLSGVLYAPHNTDTYAYRLPRVLHWLGQGRWHWIRTSDMRMNVAGCGYEWLVAPVLLLTRTDRFLFLINWVPFLLLPGMAFCVLRCLGARARVAWWWAWLLASGWCYVMQSASVSNDSFAVIYALAAVALAMKSRQTGKMADFWLSLLAAALLTGAKQTDLPLAALWMLAAWPSRRMAWAQPKTLFVMAAVGLLVSAVPISILNLRHTGTWAGVNAIEASYPNWHLRMDSPFWGIVGNLFYVPLLNLLPPFFPWNAQWNHAMEVFVATPFGAHFRSFERFGALDAGISESTAGIGLAILFMTVLSFCAARKDRNGSRPKYSPIQIALRLCPWILLLIFMAEVGETQNCRFLGAYYVFFFPSLLGRAGHEALTRRWWWQKMALCCMAFSVALLVLNTSRPLWPGATITRRWAAAHPHSKVISMLRDAYMAAPAFKKAEEQIREEVPANEPVVGFASVGNGQIEPALWLPLGTRRVETVLNTDGPSQLLKDHLHYVVIEDLPSFDCSIEDWMERYHARLISQLVFQARAQGAPQSHVYVMRLTGR